MNEIQLLHEALNLLYYYNHGGEAVQESLKKNGYNKKPIYYYFPILIRYSPVFWNYYQKTFNAPAASVQSQIKSLVKKMLKQKTSEEDLDSIDLFLAKCYKDQTNYNKLWQLAQPKGMFSADELSQLERYSQAPTGPGAEIILASLLRGGQGGYGGGGNAVSTEPTIADLTAKITDAEKITEEDKKKAAEILNNKIKLHEKDIKDPKLHAELVKKGHLTQAELDSIIELNKTDFKTAEEKEKATLDAAEKLIRGEIEKREALKIQVPQVVSQPVAVSTPSVHLPLMVRSIWKTGSSKAQIATGRFLKVSLPKALSGTGKGILKGLGIGGKAALGLGAKLGLAATGVGAPIAAILMAPTIIKVSAKIIKYTAISIGAILFYFLFNDVNTTGSLLSPGTIIESAVLPPGIDITPTGYIQNILACPVLNGTISYPSYQNAGHCSSGYGFSCPCNPIGQGRRANAIDVMTSGQNIILPQIDNQETKWELIAKNYPVNSSEGGGYGDTFRAIIGSDTWFLDLIHLQSINLDTNKFYLSGQPVAKSDGPIIHISIGKNIQDPVVISPGSNYDCSINWLPADFLCQ